MNNPRVSSGTIMDIALILAAAPPAPVATTGKYEVPGLPKDPGIWNPVFDAPEPRRDGRRKFSSGGKRLPKGTKPKVKKWSIVNEMREER